MEEEVVNKIPKITHPLGRGWDQPDNDNFLIDDSHVLMSTRDFVELLNYSNSYPTGVYEGKMWKAWLEGKWFLRWYGVSEKPDHVSNNQREILLIEEEEKNEST